MAKYREKYLWNFFPSPYPGFVQYSLYVSLIECKEMLDHYTLDQIQEFIVAGILARELLIDLRPYIRERFEKECGM